ncbi:MAG: DNA-binding protein [Candidatus Eisenbacteria sp.]|nr:DNA-binding protein [Candidatus Eisenbacteria bacterium]
MKTYTFGEDQYLLVLERGEDILRSIIEFAKEKKLEAASFQGIGAVNPARLGQYDYDMKNYRVVEVKGALEVTSLIGNIALRDGVPFAHAHMTVSNQEGRVFGGHLLEDSVCALTMEIEIRDLKGKLERTLDPRFKLGLLYDPPGSGDSE